MSLASPVIPFVQRGTIHPDQFGDRLSEFGNRLKQQNERWLTQQFFHDKHRDSEIQSVVAHEFQEPVTPAKVSQPQKKAEPKEVLTLAGAWNMYKKDKVQSWKKAISQANERFMEVLFIVLGTTTDVTTITKQDIKQVAIHPKLIEWGFLDFVNRQWKEKIFSPVSGKNMPKIGKVLADVRDQLGIPYLDDYGQRRLLHSFRHTMISACLAGWVANLSHLQQAVGHEKSSSGSPDDIYMLSLYLQCVM